jgi:hypothetical protein
LAIPARVVAPRREKEPAAIVQAADANPVALVVLALFVGDHLGDVIPAERVEGRDRVLRVSAAHIGAAVVADARSFDVLTGVGERFGPVIVAAVERVRARLHRFSCLVRCAHS